MNDVILKILEAIEYTDDRQAFVKEFMNNVYLQTLVDLAQTLPQESQEELKKASEEQFNKVLENAAKNAVTGWMQAVDPTLSDPQRQKLLDLSQQFSPPAVSQ